MLAPTRPSVESMSTEGPELLSRCASAELQPESSLCSPPVGQGVSQKHKGQGCHYYQKCGTLAEVTLFLSGSSSAPSSGFSGAPVHHQRLPWCSTDTRGRGMLGHPPKSGTSEKEEVQIL